MKNLLHNHYLLTQKRGLITPETTFDQFVAKIDEEYLELCNEYSDIARDGFSVPSQSFINECTDLVMVVMNMFQHYDVDFEDQLKANIKVQESRVKQIHS